MKKTWLPIILVCLLLVSCTAPTGNMAAVDTTQPVVQPAAEVDVQVQTAPGFWAGATQETGINTGYCPPGDIKFESGQWYFCSNAFGTSNWQLVDDAYFGTEDELLARLANGESFALFPALSVTLLTPIPDELLVLFAFGSIAIVAVSQNALQHVNLELSVPPVLVNSLPEFQQWKITTVQTAMVDQVGVMDIPTPVEELDLPRKAPPGTTAVVIEDNAMWASLIVRSLEKARITTIAVYPSCTAWRAARAAGLPVLAHVYTVDQHTDEGVWGHTCIPEIASLAPPPLVIAGFSSEHLDEVTDRWSPGQESTVRELMEEGGADFVVRKSDQFIDLLKLVTEVLGKLG